ALLVLPFIVLLSLGNSILGDTFSRLFTALGDTFENLEFPSFARFAFTAFIAVLTLALLWRSNPSKILACITATLQKSFPGPADHTVALWRTILALAGVNAVFFAANTIDVIYLWSEIPLPEHLTLSEFVHHGTANLILSVITAAAVLSALFQQHHSVTRSKRVRNLALAWIAQNLFLVYNVNLRLGSYVDNYGQSLKRLFLLLFIALVAVGFVLLAIRIIREKSFAWLVGANLTALFTLAFVTQFWDARAYVAEKNFDLAKEWKTTHVNHLYIDTQLLANLGPSAWPTLIKIAGGADGFKENEISNARRHLGSIAATHLPETVDLPWQSYSHHRQQTLAALGEYQSKSNPTAQNRY
ncbi:MAG: DUF4173 domain-containing protein, partial [Verrucomicrobiales bacterium]|nr:DUF4173 domain-containing protein [Verrucomicrobiales bacterium]